MSYIVLLIVLSAVTYRLARFIVLDTLIDEPRDKVMAWLEQHPTMFWSKVYDLLGCPWCITVWVAAAVVAIQDLALDGVPYPIWTWLAVASGSLVFWGYIDRE